MGSVVGKTAERTVESEVGNVVGSEVGKTAERTVGKMVERMEGRKVGKTAGNVGCNRCNQYLLTAA